MKVCWKCKACKGLDGNLHMAFTNTECNWKTTMYREDDPPYDPDDPPTLTGLTGWDIRMVHPDILHCWHLGLARDLLGSALVLLIKQRHYFRGRNQGDRLTSASKLLQEFAKTNKLSLRRKKLNKNALNWKSDQYPELKMKGSDIQVVSKWMSSLVEENDGGLPELATAIWASNNLLSLITNCPDFFLSVEEYSQQHIVARLCYCQRFFVFVWSVSVFTLILIFKTFSIKLPGS